MRLSTILALSALTTFAIACSKTQPEPTAVASESLTKCLRETPAAPPPEVKPATPDKCPKDPDFPRGLRSTEVTFPRDGGGAKVQVEIATESEDQEKGLMYRMQMSEDRGMLFAWKERQVHTFWMRNTCIPLDMLFIDSDGTIVGILENVPILNEESRSVGCASQYVLEVNAGWARRHGIRAGMKMTPPTL